MYVTRAHFEFQICYNWNIWKFNHGLKTELFGKPGGIRYLSSNNVIKSSKVAARRKRDIMHRIEMGSFAEMHLSRSCFWMDLRTSEPALFDVWRCEFLTN